MTTTCFATYLDPSGDACTGRVVFRLVAATYQEGLAAIFPAVPVSAVLDAGGGISVELEPTSGDDAAFDATDMTYQVWERINGVDRSPYYVDIPSADSVDLGTLATYDDPPTFVRQLVVPDVSSLATGYVPADPVLVITYNPDGTVASVVEDGVTTTYTYNANGTIATQTRLGVTRTYTYTDGNLTGVS